MAYYKTFFTQFDYCIMYIYKRCKMQSIKKFLLQLFRRLYETITIVRIHVLEVSG